MKIWVYTICKNEAYMMRWFLRHYATFADRIIVLDEHSDDGTRELLKACDKVTVREWVGHGLDDDAFIRCVNDVWYEASGKCDWVMFVDVDELLYAHNPVGLLRESKEDAVLSRGYALISQHGLPNPEFSGEQLYEIVRTGVPQPNYDKYVCWRPHVQVWHTIGRHTYGDEWPKCKGVKGTEAKLKLLHCHHIGGVEWTRKQNQRNYDRAVSKRFAWNYTPEHDKPEQAGSVAWVRDAIDNNKLVDVMAL